MTNDAPSIDVTYADDDLVYVDPDQKTVVGKVEFKENGLPIPKEMPSKFADPTDTDDDDAAKPEPAAAAKGGPKGKPDRRPARKPRKRYYPWGTYRTMKKIYKIEGKVFEAERTLTLDDVMEKALQEPYWD
jgi:hypothetical protein